MGGFLDVESFLLLVRECRDDMFFFKYSARAAKLMEFGTRDFRESGFQVEGNIIVTGTSNIE